MDLDPKVLRMLRLSDELREALDERETITGHLAAVNTRVERLQEMMQSLMSGKDNVEASPPPGTSVPELVRDYFRKHPDAQMSADDLAMAGIPATPDHLRSTLNRLKDAGFLERIGRGVYALADASNGEVGRSA